MTRGSGKAVRDYFEPVEGEYVVWQSRYKKKRKEGWGYSNFLSHVERQRPEDFRGFLDAYRDGGSNVSASSKSNYIPQSLFYSKKPVQVHAWIDIVVMGLMLFNVGSNPVFCRHMKHATICYPSLLKYMERLTTVVEKKITRILPSKFALVVDG